MYLASELSLPSASTDSLENNGMMSALPTVGKRVGETREIDRIYILYLLFEMISVDSLRKNFETIFPSEISTFFEFEGNVSDDVRGKEGSPEGRTVAK